MAKFTPNDTDNYLSFEKQVPLTVLKKTVESCFLALHGISTGRMAMKGPLAIVQLGLPATSSVITRASPATSSSKICCAPANG